MRSSTSRHIVVVEAAWPKGMFTICPPLTDPIDTVRPVGGRGHQIAEHRTRRIHPPTRVRVGQRGRHLRAEPGQLRQLPQYPHPGMRHHTLAVGRHFHPWPCGDTLHPRSAFPLGIVDPAGVSSFVAEQALSLFNTPHHTTIHEKSGLELYL
jgi:hypothetical protein